MFYLIKNLSIIKTLRFNLKYFSVKEAIKLPVLISKNVGKITIKGIVRLNCESYKIHLGMIKIGFSNLGIVDYKKEKILFENFGVIEFNGKVDIGTGSRISNHGKIVFGDDFQASGKMTIICNKQIIFGDDILVSWNTLIMDSDLHKIINIKLKEQINLDKKVIIGNHVWIGCNTTILKGTEILENTVIAAHSLISSKKVGKNEIIGSTGNILKEGITWEH